MELNVLKAFVAVARNRSFSEAALQLHLTQPAVSKRVAALEQELDARLFDRMGRNVSLTEAGEALLPRALQILKEIEDSRKIIADLSGRVRGRLSLGTSHHIGLHRLPPVLRAYSSRYPEVELDLHFLDSEAGCDEVERGRLDLAVVTLPDTPSTNLLLTPIWDDPLEIAVAHDHPLADVRDITLQELASHGAILPAVGTFTRTIVVTPFDEHQLPLKVVLETNYLETNKMMVTIGLGWSALPQTMLDRDLRSVQVKELRLRRSLGIVQHKARTLSNASQALVSMLISGGSSGLG